LRDITKYSKLGIDKIKEVNILNEDDFDTIQTLSNELQRVYQVKQIWRTETEMRYSVLNDVKFPTIESKYFQCVREQDGFFSELIRMSCEYEIKQGELEIIEIDIIELGTTKRDQARKKIKNGERKLKQFELMNLRLMAHDRIREIKLWEKLKNELKLKKDFDINDVSTHQKESYEKRWRKELDIALRSNNAGVYRNVVGHLETMEHEKDE